MVVVIAGLCLLISAIALLLATYKDIKEYKIPNITSVAVAGSFLVYALVTGMSWDTVLSHMGVALIIFVVTFLFYLRNAFGAGDVKLLSSMSLWAGPIVVWSFVFWVSFVGGVIASVLLVHAKQNQKEDKEALKQKVPYGVAIAVGGFYVLGRYAVVLAQ